MSYAYECPECEARITSDNQVGDDEELGCPFCEDEAMKLVTALVRKKKPRAGRGGTGLAVISNVAGAIQHLFRQAQTVDGSQLVDEETGMVVAESKGMTFNINEFLGDPPVESVELGDDGKVKNMKVKPHEWPPRKETF